MCVQGHFLIDVVRGRSYFSPMLARKDTKIKPKRLSQYRAAQLLRISEGHLSRVRRGERCSKRLLARLAELEKQHGPIGEGKHAH